VSLKQPFRPTGGATVNVDVGAASANVALSSGQAMLVTNNGTATAWIAFGNDNTVVATLAAGMPIGPGLSRILSVPVGCTYVAAIAAGATGKIYFTPGIGS
jgi:hypothetical protein